MRMPVSGPLVSASSTVAFRTVEPYRVVTGPGRPQRGLLFGASRPDIPLAWLSMRGQSMSEKQVVLAIFKDEAAADQAVEAMKAWDKADDDVKLNALGVLVLDDKGKIKTHKLG